MGAFALTLEPWATERATTNPTVVPRAVNAEKKHHSSMIVDFRALLGSFGPHFGAMGDATRNYKPYSCSQVFDCLKRGLVLETWAMETATTNPTVVPRAWECQKAPGPSGEPSES